MIHYDYQRKIERLKTSKIMFEVHLTEHCNLNCKGCSHFSPLAEEEFMSIDIFEKDMARMAQLLDGGALNIRLLGGEPLLHPQVNDFIKTAARYFPNARRELVTNGILLLNMSELFWDTCRKTYTLVNVTRYPISLDFTAMKIKALAENVAIIFYPDHAPKSFRKDVYDLNGMQNEQLSHSACQFFGYCCQLNNGRFYPCSISAYFHHFVRYFNLDIPLSSDNYIDIYQAQSKKELYSLITSPIPCCKYCNMSAKEFNVKWEISKQNLTEWTER